jgi:hypothetical protein
VVSYGFTVTVLLEMGGGALLEVGDVATAAPA